MKNLIYFSAAIIIIAAFSLFISAVPIADDNMAKVSQIKGVDVYLMSTPQREYDIIGEVKVSDSGFTQQYIDDWAAKYVKKAVKEFNKFDAILYKEGKIASVIRYK